MPKEIAGNKCNITFNNSLKTSQILLRTNHVTVPSLAFAIRVKFFSNKAKRASLKTDLQENKVCQIFRKQTFLTP